MVFYGEYYLVQNFSKGAVAEFLLSHVIKIPNTPWNMLVRDGGSQICKWIQYFWPPAGLPAVLLNDMQRRHAALIGQFQMTSGCMCCYCFLVALLVLLGSGYTAVLLVIWCNMILIDNIFYFCLRPQVVRIPVCWKEKASMLALNVSVAASLLWWC